MLEVEGRTADAREDPLPVRVMPWPRTADAEPEPLLSREWLVTNGLGGYASGTVAGVPTRRYHGLLIAALPAPAGRVVLLNRLAERVRLRDGTNARLGGMERRGALEVPAAEALVEFRLEGGLPVWVYAVGDSLVEKRLLMPRGQNTTHVTYRLLSGDAPVRLTVRPGLNIRPHEAPVNTPLHEPYAVKVTGSWAEFSAGADAPRLRMRVRGTRSELVVSPRTMRQLYYRIEAARGYEDLGDLWTPGSYRFDLRPGRPVTLVASAESGEPLACCSTTQGAARAERERRGRLVAAAHPAAREGVAAELVLAADAFLIAPAGRAEDEPRTHAEGDRAATVIAGYHWFTDWGRDTMISLEGLALGTGRHREAGATLRLFARHVRDGLIPNYFPDGRGEGVYHTADASLWFFHALGRYLDATGDRETLRVVLPKLGEIVAAHREGTRFGIGVDPVDGLLRQGAEGCQLTWMDAKVGDWVVTPRRGKAVEINALWYDALRRFAGWLRQEDDPAGANRADAEADRVLGSFNRRFWNDEAGFLFDVVDGEGGDDPACRPNQLFAIALDHEVLDPSRWAAVLQIVRERLLTPVGLRSLSRDHVDYKRSYHGDLPARDAAYHQGTVWGWLIGSYVDAYLKAGGDRGDARKFLAGFVPRLGEAGLGTVSEIFDAEDPFTPRGCIAQAWSVAEVLRCWIKTAGP